MTRHQRVQPTRQRPVFQRLKSLRAEDAVVAKIDLVRHPTARFQQAILRGKTRRELLLRNLFEHGPGNNPIKRRRFKSTVCFVDGNAENRVYFPRTQVETRTIDGLIEESSFGVGKSGPE